MGDKVLHFFNTETQALLYNVRNDSDHATTVLQFIKDLSLALNCWFSPLLREVFLRVLRFSPLLKNQHFQIPIRSGIR